MKKTLFIFTLLLIIVSCGNSITENTMTVTGKVKGLKKGTLYLQHIPDSVLVVIDSMQVDGDGNFSFQTELESPDVFYLYLSKKDNNTVNDRIAFFGEPGTITINTQWNTFDTQAEITGSETHEKWEAYQKTMTKFHNENLEIIQGSIGAKIPLDSLQIDSIQQLSDKNIRRSYAYALNFALTNKDSYIAPYIALNDVADANIIYLDSINNSLTPEVADSKYGRSLQKYLEDIKTSK
ncbi:FIG00652522: hypothetical protein [hydrothermal vent metagenome]|uniref:DUF4369 domain-containing protein n=1 Tax=hydrothermal vent metagenome TaxID=652676 RepID=A0A3B0TAS4_9ZZZZ